MARRRLLDRRSLKQLEPDENSLIRLLESWRQEAVAAGRRTARDLVGNGALLRAGGLWRLLGKGGGDEGSATRPYRGTSMTAREAARSLRRC